MPSCSQRLLSTTTILAVLWAGFASAQCYRPNGTAIVLADEGWFQCPSNTPNGHSQCCGKDEVCMPMGLCGTTDATQSDLSKGYWLREYCSDPTWGSPRCSNVCVQNGFNSGTVLTWCKDGSACCGFENYKCCNNGEGAFLDLNGRVIKDDPEPESTTSTTSSTSSSTSSTTSSKEPESTTEKEEPSSSTPTTTSKSTTKSTQTQVTVTQTSAITNDDGHTEVAEVVETVFTGSPVAAGTATPNASDLITPPDKGGLSGGAAAGIGAGVGIVGMLLLGGAFFLWRRNHKKKKLDQYYSAGGLPLPPYRGHQPTGSEDAAYLGGYKPTTGNEEAYSAKIAGETNHGQGYPPPPKPPVELPHHYPQQYAHELPPHAHQPAHEMPAEYAAPHEMGMGSPRQRGFGNEVPGNAHGAGAGGNAPLR